MKSEELTPSTLFRVNQGLPVNLVSFVQWTRHFWLRSGVLRRALRDVIGYFLTSIEFLELPNEKAGEYRKILNLIGIFDVLRSAAETLLVDGNVFLTCAYPFSRILHCPKCHSEQILSADMDLDIKFDFGSFKGKCTKCQAEVNFSYKDVNEKEYLRGIKFLNLPLENFEIKYNPSSGESIYQRTIEKEVIQGLLKNDLFYLATTPSSYFVLFDAKKRQYTDKLIIYKNKNFLHLALESLPGLKLQGWGLPLLVGVIFDMWNHSLIKDTESAIANDFLSALRIISPPSGPIDPVRTEGMLSFETKVKSILNVHRNQKGVGYHVLPYPIQYQTVGGEGKALFPADVRQAVLQEILNSLGVPMEFFTKNLQTQAAPMSLRLLQMSWTDLANKLNIMLQWTVDRVGEFLGWSSVNVRLQAPSLADNLERKQLMFQLAAAQAISRTTLLQALGLDIENEMKTQLEEQIKEQQMATYMQQYSPDLMAMVQQAKQPAPSGAIPSGMPEGAIPSGMPPAAAPVGPMQGPGGSQMPASIMQLEQQATQLAQQIATLPPGTQRTQMLRNLASTNPTLHALVKAHLEDLERQMSLQGREALRQQG